MKRKFWIVHIPGYKPIYMCSEPLTYDEALKSARVIWPDAEISV